MAKFNFRLQSYLNLKEKLEEQKKMEYGKALSILEEELKIKTELIKKSESIINELKTNISNKVDSVTYKNYLYYIEFLKEKLLQQETAILKANKLVEEKRRDLAEAVKDRKILDKLKEKELENYNKELLLKEQKMTDELVSYKYSKL